MTADLADRWSTLVSSYCVSDARCAEIGRAVLAAWDEPHRRYHNIVHLRDVLAHVDEVASHADDPDAVRLAAWYHDVVYRGQPDDEENSARRAEQDLGALGLPAAIVVEVARLVRLTVTHDPAPGDRNGETLCDADLAILAAPTDAYARYAESVRSEYAHVTDDAFQVGRAKVLSAMMALPALYRTPMAHERWTAQARRNIRAELDSLAAPPTVIDGLR